MGRIRNRRDLGSTRSAFAHGGMTWLAAVIDLPGDALLTTLSAIKRALPRQSQHVTNDANALPLVRSVM